MLWYFFCLIRFNELKEHPYWHFECCKDSHLRLFYRELNFEFRKYLRNMRVASTIVCGIVLAYVVVGAIAPNPAIGHLSTPGRGGEKDDTKPQHQLRKLLERYTLRAPMERSDHSSGIGFRSSYAEKMRRRLVQFTNESPKSAPPSQAPQTGPAPAPGPQAEMTPPPPPINPFVPPENDTLTCCCRSTSSIS